MRKPSLTIISYGLVSWLFIGIVGSLIWLKFSLDSSYKEIQNHGRNLSTVVTQRLDQNEAVLFGLEALFRSLKSADISDIHRYAEEMIKRYPHLYTIGYQPKVNYTDLQNFESAQKKVFGYDFYVKDFDLSGARKFNPVSPRKFYYPVIFMEPNLPEARNVYGLDVYHDPILGVAIDQAVKSGKMVVSEPFDLIEGGRGYILFKSVRNNNVEPVLISLLIRSDKLLRRDEVKFKNVNVVLNDPNFYQGDKSQRGVLFSSKRINYSSLCSWFFPHYSYNEVIDRVSQKYYLDIEYNPGIEILKPVPLIIIWLGSALLVVIIIIFWFGRKQAQEAQAIAEAKIVTERTRSEVSRLDVFDEMASGIAHELNQPLGAILSYNQASIRLLNDNPSDYSIVIEAMRKSANEAQRAAGIIQKLRTLAIRQPPVLAEVNLKLAVYHVLDRLSENIKEFNVLVEIDVDEGTTVYADMLQLEQVIENILRNALDALGLNKARSGIIKLTSSNENSRVLIDIADNGLGVDSVVRKRLFYPFVTTKKSGMGLGLSLSQAMVESFGGRIEMRDNIPFGTVFCITLNKFNADK